MDPTYPQSPNGRQVSWFKISKCAEGTIEYLNISKTDLGIHIEGYPDAIFHSLRRAVFFQARR